jgi:hypothetical protein
MTNSSSSNVAIYAAAATNMKVLGTGFTRGTVSVNLTNTITGTNIISDAGVVVNI